MVGFFLLLSGAMSLGKVQQYESLAESREEGTLISASHMCGVKTVWRVGTSRKVRWFRHQTCQTRFFQY